MVLPAFDRLIVPPSFQGRFAAYMAILLPGFAAITIFQAALYPVFLIGKRTGIATFAALLGLAVNVGLGRGPGVGLGAVWPMPSARRRRFLVVLAVTGVAALRGLPHWPPCATARIVLLAVRRDGAAIWPLRDRFVAPVELALQVASASSIYRARSSGSATSPRLSHRGDAVVGERKAKAVARRPT